MVQIAEVSFLQVAISEQLGIFENHGDDYPQPDRLEREQSFPTTPLTLGAHPRPLRYVS